jgi:hypothetical protein
MSKSPARKVRHAVLTSACLAIAAAGLPVACASKAPVAEQIQGCMGDSECAADHHCQAGACLPDCSPQANNCPVGQTCGSDGRCTSTPTGGTGGTAGGGAGSGIGGTIPVPEGGPDADLDADACASATVDFTVQPPNVMLVVDRSGSMAEEIDPTNLPGVQRWQAAREALVNATMGVVPLVQAGVNLGLTLYTAPTGMPAHVGHMSTVGTADPDYTESAECPFLVQVPIALNNFAAIEAAYRPITMYSNPTAQQMQDRLPAGATPTGESIQAVIPVLQALDPVLFPGPKAIVLATDGEPNGCGTNVPQGQGRMNSVNAVQAAFDANIRTFVVSVGDDVGLDHLRQLANIGQGFPAMDPMDRFYVATNPAALADALKQIFTDVRSCTFMVDGRINPNRAGTGVVTIDGMPITFEDPNGWRVNSETEIEILGTACDTIKMGDHNVEIRFPCGAIDPF